MLGVPPESAYDLRFRAFGIPIRVSPWFWLVSAMMGAGSGGAREVILWVICVFVSILIHELGHGLTSRVFGAYPFIVIHGMGGVCISEVERRPWQRMLVILAGPGAGFVFCGLVYAIYHLTGGEERLSLVGREVYFDLIFINLIWGCVNLLPIWFLDGGQFTQVVLNLFSRKGTRWTHVISLITAGVLAALSVMLLRILSLALFFGIFAILNYMALKAIREHYAYYDSSDDADWWKR